ncbi:hypothetical protein BHE74_00026132 [Ensete ventricosum]|nr:hypothetical protein BHE74_00026132 [Ensete ventricosum]
MEGTAHGATTEESYGLLLGRRTSPSTTEEGLVHYVCGGSNDRKCRRQRQKQC